MLSRRHLIVAGLAVACPAVLRAAPLQLRLAHGLPATHPVHPAMQHFADLVRSNSHGELEIALFADGQLGQERDLISQVQAGKLDFLKVSGSLLERFDVAYRVLNLPFTLRDRDHWQRVTSSELGREILQTTASAGLIGLTFYDAGSRSFYGNKAIHHPDDLRGMKIRIQSSPTMTSLIQLLGAETVELAWSNVYVALKSGVVDAAENSVVALIVGRHGEVVSHYSADEHTRIPDVLLVADARMKSLTPRQQDIVREAAAASYLLMNRLWATFDAQARIDVEKMGVRFVAPDRAAFMTKAAHLADIYAGEDDARRLLRRIANA